MTATQFVLVAVGLLVLISFSGFAWEVLRKRNRRPAAELLIAEQGQGKPTLDYYTDVRDSNSF